MAAAAAAVTAVPLSCCGSKREGDNVGSDIPKMAKKGRSPPPEVEEEMEAFFAAAESSVARRFASKYNYDVIMDAPMDGRYEWVRVISP